MNRSCLIINNMTSSRPRHYSLFKSYLKYLKARDIVYNKNTITFTLNNTRATVFFKGEVVTLYSLYTFGPPAITIKPEKTSDILKALYGLNYIYYGV